MMDQNPTTLSYVGTALLDTLQRITNDVAAVTVFIAKQYAEAGMPYGPTSEGLWRWLKELGDKIEGNDVSL